MHNCILTCAQFKKICNQFFYSSEGSNSICLGNTRNRCAVSHTKRLTLEKCKKFIHCYSIRSTGCLLSDILWHGPLFKTLGRVEGGNYENNWNGCWARTSVGNGTGLVNGIWWDPFGCCENSAINRSTWDPLCLSLLTSHNCTLSLTDWGDIHLNRSLFKNPSFSCHQPNEKFPFSKFLHLSWPNFHGIYKKKAGFYKINYLCKKWKFGRSFISCFKALIQIFFSRNRRVFWVLVIEALDYSFIVRVNKKCDWLSLWANNWIVWIVRWMAVVRRSVQHDSVFGSYERIIGPSLQKVSDVD